MHIIREQMFYVKSFAGFFANLFDFAIMLLLTQENKPFLEPHNKTRPWRGSFNHPSWPRLISEAVPCCTR